MGKTRVYTDESGRTSFLDPKTNEYVWIPGDQAQAAVNAGLTPETPEMFHRRSASHDTSLSAALGLLRGGTFGGSDILLRQVAPQFADYARTLREENAGTSLGPEALGMTATSFLTGGIGAAAPAAAAARGLGSTILRGAGRGLIEGGIAGAGLAAGQAQLEDRDLGGTITEAARGAAAGAATGGILGGAAAPIGRSLARGAARQAAKKAQAAAEAKVTSAAANTELDELAKIMGMEPDQAIRRLYSDIAQKRMVGEGLKSDWIALKELIGNAGADDAYRTLQSSIRGVDDVPKQGSAAFNALRKELDESLFGAAQRIEGGKYLEFFDEAGRWSGRARPGQSAPHSLDLQVASTFDDVGKLYGQLKKQVKKVSGVDIQVPGRDQLMGAGVMGGLVNQGVYQITRSGAMAKLAGLAMQGGRRLAQNTVVRGVTRGLGRMTQMAAVDMAAQLASDVTARQDYEAAYTGMPGSGQTDRKGADLTREAIDSVVRRKQLGDLAADIPPDATETHAEIQGQMADLTAKIGEQQRADAQQHAARGGKALASVIGGQLAARSGDAMRGMGAADVLLASALTGKKSAHANALLFGSTRSPERFGELKATTAEQIRQWREQLEALDMDELASNTRAGYEAGGMAPEQASGLAHFQADRAQYLRDRISRDQITASLAINAAVDPRAALARISSAEPTHEDIRFIRATMPVLAQRMALVAKQALRLDQQRHNLRDNQRRTLSLMAGDRAASEYYATQPVLGQQQQGAEPARRPARKINPPQQATRIQRAAAQI